MALITAAQFLQHYRSITGTGEDTNIDFMIARADGLMAAFCGFPLPDSGGHTMEDVTYTLKIDAPSWEHPRVLDLGIRPVVSVTTAHSDPNWDYGADTLVAAGDLVLEGNKGRLWLRPDASSSWSTSPLANKIVVVAGWATTPPALVAIAAATVRHLLDGNKTGAVQALTQGGQSLTREAAGSLLPQAVQDALGPYVCWGSRVG